MVPISTEYTSCGPKRNHRHSERKRYNILEEYKIQGMHS
jgi:hypothetical protein